MTVTFGRLGRWFLVTGGVTLALALAGRAVLGGPAGHVVSLSAGIVGLLALALGVLWTVLQHRMFGGVAALERVSVSGRSTTATIVGVRGTSGAIGAEPIVRLDLLVDGRRVRRHVRVPFNHAAAVRVGTSLPVRVDPAGSRALVVEWERVTS